MSKPRTPRSNDRRQIARIYRTSYPRADTCQILTCLSLSVIQSPIILPGGRILLRRLSGTERHAAFLYRFFPRNSKLDSHWTSNPSLHCSQPPLRTWITRYTYTYYISRRGQTSQNRDTFVYTYIPLRTLDLGGSDRSPRATTGGNTKDFHGLVVRAKCVVHELAEGENSARGQRRDITRTDDRRAETPWKRGAPATLR